jgi:hypothetical protein
MQHRNPADAPPTLFRSVEANGSFTPAFGTDAPWFAGSDPTEGVAVRHMAVWCLLGAAGWALIIRTTLSVSAAIGLSGR